jgi:hypothetical protein
MALENNPSAKMTIKSRGQLMVPGTCMVCGNGNFEGDYLDLGVFFDYEGHMAMCKTCVVQAGETVGMFTADEHLELLKKFNDAVTDHEHMEQELENVRNQLASARNLLASYLTSDSSVVVSEGTERQDEDSSSTVSASDSGEPEVTEPVPSARRSNTGGSKSGNTTTRKFT